MKYEVYPWLDQNAHIIILLAIKHNDDTQQFSNKVHILQELSDINLT